MAAIAFNAAQNRTPASPQGARRRQRPDATTFVGAPKQRILP